MKSDIHEDNKNSSWPEKGRNSNGRIHDQTKVKTAIIASTVTMIISIPYRIAFYITCSPVFMMGIHPRETIQLLGFGKRNGPVLCLRLLRVKNTTWSNLVKLYVYKYLVDETRFHFR